MTANEGTRREKRRRQLPLPTVMRLSDCAVRFLLAAVLALASSFRDRPVPNALAAIGEVGLSGELRAVSALGQRLAEVQRLGFHKCLIPKRVQGKLTVPEELELIRVSNIREAMAALL